MAEKTYQTRIKLKRDNSFNYSSTFVPLKGEYCLVDTENSGLRIKCGDGVTTWGELEFIDDILITGYFLDGNFYSDTEKITESTKNINRIYIDLATAKLYVYNGTSFVLVGGTDTPLATSEISGTVKLYNTIGANTDGTMTQYAITSALSKKVEVDVKDELLTLNTSNILS